MKPENWPNKDWHLTKVDRMTDDDKALLKTKLSSFSFYSSYVSVDQVINNDAALLDKIKHLVLAAGYGELADADVYDSGASSVLVRDLNDLVGAKKQECAFVGGNGVAHPIQGRAIGVFVLSVRADDGLPAVIRLEAWLG